MTYFDPMSYSELIPTMRVLYDNLLNCNPVNLLGFARPAFSFISNDGLGQCNCWPLEVLTEVQAFFQLHQNKVVPILQVILPRPADGFAKQRGHIFGFGNGNNEAEVYNRNERIEIFSTPSPV